MLPARTLQIGCVDMLERLAIHAAFKPQMLQPLGRLALQFPRPRAGRGLCRERVSRRAGRASRVGRVAKVSEKGSRDVLHRLYAAARPLPCANSVRPTQTGTRTEVDA